MSVRHPALLLLGSCLLSCSSSSGGAPSFSVSLRSLRFGTVVAGSGASLPLRVKSESRDVVHLAVKNVGAGIAVSPPALDLPAGATRDLTVTVTGTAGMLLSRFELSDGARSTRIEATGVIVVSAISAPPSVVFGDLAVGNVRATKLPVTNLLDRAVQLTAVIPAQAQAGFTTGASGPVVLEPKGVTELDVTFAPTCVGEVGATLVLSTCTGCADTEVTLNGNATGEVLAVSPFLLDFGNVAPGGRKLQELTVENQGCTPLTLASADAGAAPFAAAADLPVQLATSSPVKVPVAFGPPSRGPYSGDLMVRAGSLSQKVVVRGQGGGPELAVTPGDLDVGVRTVSGDVQPVGKVTLKHAGDPGKLLVAAIEVVDGPFAVSTARTLPADLAPGPIVATVSISSTTVGSYEGHLRIRPDDVTQPVTVVPLHGRVVDGPACQVALTAASLRFGLVAENDVRVREIGVRNIGTETCQAWDFRTDGGTFFGVQDPPGVATIPAGGEQVVRVQYAPTSSTGKVEAAKLTFQAMGAAGRTELPLTALATPYQVTAEPPALDLGTGPVGAQRIGAVALTNRSTGRVILTDVKIGDVPSVRVAAAPVLPRSLLGGQVATAFAVTDPVREGPTPAELQFVLYGFDEPLIVPVTATAGPGPCGTACTAVVAACPGDQSALVGEDLPLLGVGRLGSGEDATCAWSVVVAPQGSVAAPAAGGGCSAGFQPDLPGDYTLHLAASASGSDAGCATHVHVASYSGLRVVLTWDAPEDVDLHLVHPTDAPDLSQAAAWFVNPSDCWFINPHPLWDGAGRDDDPLLARDDQVGMGPEEIRVDAPSTEHVYEVGAHWYEVKNSSPLVNVTARVYCGDAVAATATATLGRKWDGAFLGEVSWQGAGTCTFEPRSSVVQAAPHP